MGEMLSVKNINVFYGSIHAIRDVSFHVDEGEIVTLIGANGAGKTTTMHAISGLLKLRSGEITYCGQLISKMEAHKIIRLGLAQVPEVAADFQWSDRAAEPADGRLHPPRQQRRDPG